MLAGVCPGVAELVEDPQVGVGVVDAGGERIDPGLVAEGEPAGEVALVGLPGGRSEADQVAGGQVVEGAEPLGECRQPTGHRGDVAGTENVEVGWLAHGKQHKAFSVVAGGGA